MCMFSSLRLGFWPFLTNTHGSDSCIIDIWNRFLEMNHRVALGVFSFTIYYSPSEECSMVISIDQQILSFSISITDSVHSIPSRAGAAPQPDFSMGLGAACEAPVRTCPRAGRARTADCSHPNRRWCMHKIPSAQTPTHLAGALPDGWFVHLPCSFVGPHNSALDYCENCLQHAPFCRDSKYTHSYRLCASIYQTPCTCIIHSFNMPMQIGCFTLSGNLYLTLHPRHRDISQYYLTTQVPAALYWAFQQGLAQSNT